MKSDVFAAGKGHLTMTADFEFFFFSSFRLLKRKINFQ